MSTTYEAKLAYGLRVSDSDAGVDGEDHAYDIAEAASCGFTQGGGEYTDEGIYYVFHSGKTSVANDGSAVDGTVSSAELNDLDKIAKVLKKAGIAFKGPAYFAILTFY